MCQHLVAFSLGSPEPADEGIPFFEGISLLDVSVKVVKFTLGSYSVNLWSLVAPLRENLHISSH